MTSCREFESDLVDYVYGELADPAQFEAHLAGCERCRSEVEQLRAVRVTLQSDDVASDSAFLATRIKARLRAEAARPSLFARLFSLRGGLAVATAALLVVVCLCVFHMADRDTGFASPPAVSDDFGARLDQARALAAGNRHAEALAACRELLSRYPYEERRDVLYALAIASAQHLGRDQEAKELATQRSNEQERKKNED